MATDNINTKDNNNPDNAKKAFEYLVSKGVKEHIAAGLVGNLMQESYGLEKVWASGELDNVGSKGIMQWHGKRLNDLYDFVKEKDPNYTNGKPISLYDQLDFILYEAETGAGDPWMKKQYDKAFAASNAQEAALSFSKNVLRPSSKHAMNDRRIAYANKFGVKNDSGDIEREPNPYNERTLSAVSVDNTAVANNQTPKLFNSSIFSDDDFFGKGTINRDVSSINPNIEPQDEVILKSDQVSTVQPNAKKESYSDFISKYISENANRFAQGGSLRNKNENKLESFNSFDNGGTHEQNPHGGIPIGFDPQGIMNTVEEGETSYEFSDGKYIFSNRIKL